MTVFPQNLKLLSESRTKNTLIKLVLNTPPLRRGVCLQKNAQAIYWQTMTKTYKKAEIKTENGKTVITAIIDKEVLEEARNSALKEMLAEAELPGFRKGKVPESLFVERVGELTVLQEGAERAIANAYPEIITDNKISPVSRPKIRITKIAAGNDLEFDAEVETMPEINLPDYKAIAKAAAPAETGFAADDNEVNEVIHQLQHRMMPQDGKEHDHPEINNEFAKKMGGFETVDELREAIRKNIVSEKELRAKDKRRAEIAEKISDGIKEKIPASLIEDEIMRMMERLKHDISRVGVKWEDYLKNAKKTEEEIKVEITPDAEKRVKLELAVVMIAEKENLSPSKDEITNEAQELMAAYPAAEPIRAEEYVRNILTNKKVFEFLESI